MREDWIECKLGDLLILSNEKHKPLKKEKIFYVGLEHIQKSTGSLKESVGIAEITTVKNKFSQGQILYGKLRPYFNKVYLAKEDGVCSTDILVFSVSNDIEDKYALHYMLSRKFVNDMSENTNGVSLPRVSTKYVTTYKFPLAPLPIQRAIVSKIEALFSDLDNGIANFKKAQEQLKIYRQAVLKKAFDGKLSEPRFTGLNDEHDLEKSSKSSNHKNPDSDNLPKGWKWVELGEVIEKPKYGTSKKCDYKNGNIAVLRIPNISNGYIDNSDLKYASFTNEEVKDFSLSEGDLLIIRSNGSVDLVGKCALIKKNETKYLYAGYLIRLRPLKELLNSQYLVHLMFSVNLRIQIESFAKSTSGVNNINARELSNLIIPLPSSLEEQTQIVQEIERRLSVCDKMEQSLKESIAKAEALRQSILKKAFEGKLLSEAEIALCKQEADYEPASELLKKIQAEKLAKEQEKKKPILKKKGKK